MDNTGHHQQPSVVTEHHHSPLCHYFDESALVYRLFCCRDYHQLLPVAVVTTKTVRLSGDIFLLLSG